MSLIGWGAAWAVAALYGLWGLFLAVMALNRARRAGTLSKPALVLGLPLTVLAFAVDVVVNLTLGTLILVDRPREWTLSKRLTRLERGPGWRSVVAHWICVRLLDTFDPDGRHC